MILQKIDIATILSLAAMFWIFNSRLDKKFDKIEKQLENLTEDLKDVDRRLCRIEGSMASKDCCMLKDDRHMRKAE